MPIEELEEFIEHARSESAEVTAELASVRMELDDKRVYRDAIRSRLVALKYAPVLHTARGNEPRKSGGLITVRPGDKGATAGD